MLIVCSKMSNLTFSKKYNSNNIIIIIIITTTITRGQQPTMLT